MSDPLHSNSQDHVPGMSEESEKADAHLQQSGVADEVASSATGAGSAIVSVTLPGELKDRLDRVVESDPDLDESTVVRTALERYLSGE